MSKTLFYASVILTTSVLSCCCIEATTRIVDSTSDNPMTVGTLSYWLLNASGGDTLDCSAIAGQQITLTLSLPAITKSYTINGSKVTIDGNGSYQAFQVASGALVLNDITVQNALSKGGNGGDGYSGGGGGVGGGGALYIHGGSSVTLSATTLLNNKAQGGNGGSASSIGNAGAGGGGGFGGGNGGSCMNTVSTGGGGGGHSNGGNGGSESPINGGSGFYFGGAGGGAGVNSIVSGGRGGNAGTFTGGLESSGNGGGGAGSSQNGFSATGSSVSGIPGNGGKGIGADLFFGAGGGGGASAETGFAGASGVGAAGGGGGSNYAGGNGGILGGGGGGGLGTFGGQGGFGAGGGGASTGGIGGAAGGGNGASDPANANGAGGGGSGLGGAIFVQAKARLIIVDGVEFSGNTVVAGTGGTSTNSSDPNYIPAGNGSQMGYDLFVRQGGSITFDIDDSLTLATPIEGDALTLPRDGSGWFIKKGTGVLELNGANTYVGKTTIEQGTIRLNGSINDDLHIKKHGTLTGNATVNGDLRNEGIISPGNSIGTIYTTTLVLTSTSIYKIEIDPSDSDHIHATDTATLAGTIEVVQAPGNYSKEGRYRILTTSHGLFGNIGSLKIKGLPGYKFSLSRDAFNLYLDYVKEEPCHRHH